MTARGQGYWLNDRMGQGCWMNDWMIEWVRDIDWMIEWLNGSGMLIEWLDDWMIEWLNDSKWSGLAKGGREGVQVQFEKCTRRRWRKQGSGGVESGVIRNRCSQLKGAWGKMVKAGVRRSREWRDEVSGAMWGGRRKGKCGCGDRGRPTWWWARCKQYCLCC